MIEPGEIRWFRYGRPDKRRPVLVVGRKDLIDAWSRVPVIPLSTQVRGLPWEVHLGVADGLPSESVLKIEWISAVERATLGPLLATLPEHRWSDVRRAVLRVLGLDR